MVMNGGYEWGLQMGVIDEGYKWGPQNEGYKFINEQTQPPNVPFFFPSQPARAS